MVQIFNEIFSFDYISSFKNNKVLFTLMFIFLFWMAFSFLDFIDVQANKLNYKINFWIKTIVVFLTMRFFVLPIFLKKIFN